MTLNSLLRPTNLLPADSRSKWNLEMLVFEGGGGGGGELENEKNPQSRDENQQQTQPTHGVESGNRTRATLVGVERP